ncbi:MAG: hypothetical protein H6748_22515, partial [Spirochaetaceae bacterium]|nr:hypothetical protein [Spirochaetaceae bacterium]
MVAAWRRGRSFEVRWAVPRETWDFDGIELRARPEDAREGERAWTRSRRYWPFELQTGELLLGSARDWLLFDPPLPEGAVAFDLRVRFVQGDEVKIVETELRALPAHAAPSAAPQSDGEGQVAPAPTPAPRGCACVLADAEGGPASCGALLLLVALGRRRRAIFVVLVALVVIILAPARPAAAASLPHYDLRSLALQSDAIVRVRIVDEPDDPSAPITHQIVTSYLGELEVGAELRLPHAGYSSRTGSFGEGKRAFDDDAVLFLQRAAEGDPSGWRLTESGLRRCAEGLVYRYQQANNPGPYVSVPQGHDPFDVYGDPRGDPGLSMEEFEVEVLAAIAGAVAIRADLERIDDPAARARLLDRIGPAFGDDRDEPTMLVMLAIDDQASLTIIEGLWRAGHREDALAGVDRLRFPLGYWDLALGAAPGWLLDVAEDRRRPTPLRRGALLLLEHDLRALTAPDAIQRLIALLDDPEPELRALASTIDAARDAQDRWREALIARLRVDTEPAVRFALIA